nr:MAG TPA: hypothetical protein [Bacteriophage sp.]
MYLLLYSIRYPKSIRKEDGFTHPPTWYTIYFFLFTF